VLRAGKSDDAIEVAAKRIKEAEMTGASILVTACPFCVRNLNDGAESIDSKIRIMSLDSLVASLIE
jgi:heterodisulfide reductase subunit D